MNQMISIIIPNYNGSRTIGICLDSIFVHDDPGYEVIVVDDCSDDRSREIIRKYPCKLIELKQRSAASAARNAGAFSCTGDILFFIDADCILKDDSLSVVRKHLAMQPHDRVIGGTYTPMPYDQGFFNAFQSVFVNFFETKNSSSPDYLAAHALVIHASIFKQIGGFRENFLPILEDVEFCHRLRKAGYSLMVAPDLQVRHVFNFSFKKSLRNAIRKTRYWVEYSLMNRDLFADSGTSSREIKINGGVWLATLLLMFLAGASGWQSMLIPLPLLWTANMYLNRQLFRAFHAAGGVKFAFLAGMYYGVVYPAALWMGAGRGFFQYLTRDARGSLSSDPPEAAKE
jgi:glycosyltransferase involved in cell wall biosynthesis